MESSIVKTYTFTEEDIKNALQKAYPDIVNDNTTLLRKYANGDPLSKQIMFQVVEIKREEVKL